MDRAAPSPTIAAVTDEMVRRLVTLEGRSPENTYAMKLARKTLETVLATPSPTIAADDGECDECERKELQISAMLQAAYRAQLDGNPLGASQAIIEAYRHANDEDCADLEAPTIAAEGVTDSAIMKAKRTRAGKNDRGYPSQLIDDWNRL